MEWWHWGGDKGGMGMMGTVVGGGTGVEMLGWGCWGGGTGVVTKVEWGRWGQQGHCWGGDVGMVTMGL